MKTGSVPTRMTRTQLQEKFKKNFQALCAKCPQLSKNHETLDDSLTSLQWLWNLNVNISNPTNHRSKSSTSQRSCSNELSRFPSALLNRVDDGTTTAVLSGELHKAPSTPKSNAVTKNCIIHSTNYLNTTKATIHITTAGTMKSLSKRGKNTLTNVCDSPLQRTSNSEKNFRCQFSSNLVKKNGQEASKFESASEAELKLELEDLSHFSSSKPNNLEEEVIAKASSVGLYSFSPRETMLDQLPGQIDYKNNPYLKPNFSFITLICMAIQSSRNQRLTFSCICKWITDNFMYYRYADQDWQNSIKLKLTQSKYFSKVQKKKDAANSLWEISREYEQTLKHVTSPLLNGAIHDTTPRFDSAQGNISPSYSLSISSASKLTDNNAALTMVGRKRKQTAPQKLARRRSMSAKKRRARLNGAQNLLQEEAPELGSLKGDFNWNTIFDNFFGTNDVELSVTPTSFHSRSSTREKNDVTGRYSDDVVSGSLLAHDMLVLPDPHERNIQINSKSAPPNLYKKPSKWCSPNDCNLHPGNFQNCFSEPLFNDAFAISYDKEDSIKEILEVDDLSSSLTGKRLGHQTSWMPQCADLDEILRDNKQSDISMEEISPEVERLFSATCLEPTNFRLPQSDKGVLICPNNTPAGDELLASLSRS